MFKKSIHSLRREDIDQNVGYLVFSLFESTVITEIGTEVLVI